MQKIVAKVRAVAAARPSFHGSCFAWNCYILSCARHIWAIFYVTRKDLQPFNVFAKEIFWLGSWCSPAMLYALNSAIGLSGFPCDPLAIAHACFITAQIKHADTFAPLQILTAQQLEAPQVDNGENLAHMSPDLRRAVTMLSELYLPFEQACSLHAEIGPLRQHVQQRYEHLQHGLQKAWEKYAMVPRSRRLN